MDSKELLQALKADALDRDGLEDPTLRAIVELADWLAYPTELGEYPDELDVIDARALYWPPVRETLALTLLCYRVRDESGFEPDQVGVGLVGSVTFSLFSCENHLRPVEDCYAIHCYWECHGAGLLVESERVTQAQVAEAVKAGGIDIAGPSPVLCVRFPRHARTKRLAPLDYPGTEVILLAGAHDGASGWLACDGPRTTWYPAAEQPSKAAAQAVAMVHVGRVLLGFDVRGVARATHVAATFNLDDETFLQRYERALTSARQARGARKEKAFDSFGALARHASRYVKLLTARGRAKDARTLIDELTPFWEHNAGYATLGALAFEAKWFEASRHFIEKLRQSYQDHHRSETMGLLARIYASEGRKAEGIALLKDCISRIEADEQCTAREVALFSEPLLATLRELEA